MPLPNTLRNLCIRGTFIVISIAFTYDYTSLGMERLGSYLGIQGPLRVCWLQELIEMVTCALLVQKIIM